MRSRPTGVTRRARRLALALPAALAPAVAGGFLLLTGGWRDAEVGGLRLHVERIAWVHDAMDHGDKSSMPAAMVPDMPPRGEARLSVEVSLFNRSPSPLRFAPEEIRLYSGDGRVWPPSIAEVDTVTLGRLQAFSTRISFDVPEAAGELRLAWERDASQSTLASVRQERRAAESVKAPPEWPSRSADLPPGDAAAGARLFATTLACASCHGRPETAGSATLGPDLGQIAAAGATRAEGQGVADYIYQSLLDPDALIAPSCAGGKPCQKPSAMPPYGERMSLQDMADLLAYLMKPIER
jgi:mono/diheme cytochrome c family protein